MKSFRTLQTSKFPQSKKLNAPQYSLYITCAIQFIGSMDAGRFSLPDRV